MDNVSLFFLIFNLHGRFRLLDTLMVFGATYLIYLLLLFVLILAFTDGIREKKAFLTLLFALPVAILIAKLIPLLFYEQRPFVVFHFLPLIGKSADASFPSRHTTILTTIACSFAYFKSKWAILLVAMAFFVGVSRIYVGVHYPSDIAGGFLTGIIALIVTLQMKKLLQARFFGKSL